VLPQLSQDYSSFWRKSGKEDPLNTVEIIDETGTGLTEADKKAIISAIKIQNNGENLSIQTIAQICDATLKLASPQFIELTRRDRKERRSSKNLRRYIELWDDYAQRLEEVIESSQRAVLKELGLSDAVWENSNGFYMNQGNHELMMLHASLPQKLKMSLGSTRALSQQEFKQVLRAQVELLNKEADNSEEIAQLTKRPEEAAPIVQNRVNDRIFEDYGVEEEDIYVSMKKYMMDPEVQQIFMELQQATMKMMPQQGGGFF